MPATADPVISGDRQSGPDDESITSTGIDRVASGTGSRPLGRIEIALVFGLPIFLALAGVLTWWSIGRVESRVEADLRADLAAAGVDLDEVAIDVTYRDAEVEGLVDRDLDLDAAESAADGGLLRELDLDGLRPAPAEDRSSTADPAELARGPVRVNVVYDGLTLRINGTVLNEGQHNVVIETLDLLTGRAEITGELAISRLAPAVDGVDDRIADLVTAVESMDLADEWAIRLTDRGLAIEATVGDPEAAAAVGALDRLLTSTPTTIEVTDPNAPAEEA